MITAWLLVATLAMIQGSGGESLRFTQSGAGLLRDCDATLDETKPLEVWLDAFEQKARCNSYIDGLGDGLWLTGRLCAPQGVTHGQSVLVIQKYLRDRPERLHEPRRDLASEALTKAFPCPK